MISTWLNLHNGRCRKWCRRCSCAQEVLGLFLLSQAFRFAGSNSSTTSSTASTVNPTEFSTASENISLTSTASSRTSEINETTEMVTSMVNSSTTMAPISTTGVSTTQSNISSANGTSVQPNISTTVAMPTNLSTPEASGNTEAVIYNPNGVCVRCEDLSDAFIVCEHPSEDSCAYGEQTFAAVGTANATCKVLQGIVCFGPGDLGCGNGEDLAENETRVFIKERVPCVKYSQHQLLSSVLVSIFFGFLGADRFMLGWTRLGLAKLFTLSMLGVWWLVDIALLAGGQIIPADGSLWAPFY